MYFTTDGKFSSLSSDSSCHFCVFEDLVMGPHIAASPAELREWLVQHMMSLISVKNIFQKITLWFTLKQNLLQMQKEMQQKSRA